MTLAHRLAWFHRLGMPLYHLAAVATLVWVRPGRTEIVLFLTTYVARALGITTGYHRLFTHRAFETTRPVAFLLAFCGAMAGQGTISRWVLHHRKHHRNVERRGDPHSPRVDGLWHAHVGWLFSVATFEDEEEARRLRERWPTELRWLDRAIPVLLVLCPAALYAIGGVSFVGWGYFVPIVLFWHATFLVNSLGHYAGARPFATADDSRNIPVLAALVLGEGWHNNHHAWPKNARFGLRASQPDPGYWLIQLLALVGMAKNVTEKSETDIQRARAAKTAGPAASPKG